MLALGQQEVRFHKSQWLPNNLPFLTIPDPQSVNIWCAETLSALACTQEEMDLRKEQMVQHRPILFESLTTCFTKLFESEEALMKFHENITVPAMTIVSKLQRLTSAHSLHIGRTAFLD